MGDAGLDQKRGFFAFYRGPYLDEHSHPVTVAAHVFGAVAGLAFAVWAATSPWWWLVLLFPVVHAVPGLIAHRLFERNADVGDLRIARKDYPPHWFIAANHLLVLDLLRGGPRR